MQSTWWWIRFQWRFGHLKGRGPPEYTGILAIPLPMSPTSQGPVVRVVASLLTPCLFLLLLSVGLQVRILLIYCRKKFNILQPELARIITVGRTEPVESLFSPKNLSDSGCGIKGNFSYYVGMWCRQSQHLTKRPFLPRTLPFPTSAPSWVS